MNQVTFKGVTVNLAGTFVTVGQNAPDFKLTTQKLQDLSLADFSEPRLLLSIFPSIDTETCADSVRQFNIDAANLPGTKVLCISKDLPFAQARFCGAEDIKDVMTLSAFRSANFASDYGVGISSGLLVGLLARALTVLDQERKVVYTELVPEITSKPNYDQCLTFIKSIA